MSVYSKLNLAGKLGKSVGYIMFAVNSIMAFASKMGRNAYDKVSNRPRYNVTVHVQGVELHVKRAIYASAVSKLMDAMRVIKEVEMNVQLADDEFQQRS